ncbi:SCO7613 C-terminal domain-containing membrane protein [Nocardiopsis sp. JB363]|uniref:SCO7613 C-terminal domain-containing membrane protein n=1 Tax=Nocardiopsis sp. JB363 TaxID=1434837 RepID=UPI000B36454A|nr:DUF2157 domain-containing protein [Nocardiopsis sp. JB363]
MNAQGTPRRPGAPHRCPDCRAVLATSVRACPHCGLGLVGPTAQRLWWIDSELASVELRRHTLLEERPGVLARLRWETRAAEPIAPRAAPGAPSHPAEQSSEHASASAPPPGAPARDRTPHPTTAPSAPAREVSPRSAQNVILGLGALLIGIAALVFAVWTWSDLGTGARATVLGLTTLTFTVMALPLYRRGLHSTAEAVGVVAAFLMCVDALALWFLSDRLTNGPGYTAAALAVIGALLALYPVLVPLRSPRVLAALLAQPVPVLLVASLPDVHPVWLLTSLGATALADAVAVLLLGAPRPGAPVRTLRASAVTLWLFSSVATVVVVAVAGTVLPIRDSDPFHWWGLAGTLFLGGATGLLSARGPGRNADAPSFHSVAGLSVLALLPLAAGPSTLPALPRVTVPPWSVSPSEMSTKALALLGSDGRAMPEFPTVYLIGVVVAALLALGAVWLLRRRSLFVIAMLLAPSTLLAVPVLLGMSQTITVVWALLVGAALVLSAGVAPRGLSSTPVLVGSATLFTGLVWALPERYTTLAALLLIVATAMVAAAGARRFAGSGHRPEPGGRVAGLYMGAMLPWALVLLTGSVFMIVNRGAADTEQAQWWLLTATVVLTGATALLMSRVPTPSSLSAPTAPNQPDQRTDLRGMFSVVGVLLLPAAPLLALPSDRPALALFSSEHTSWSASPGVVREPASAVLGSSAQPDPLTGALSALGVVAVGALALALVVFIERRWTAVGVALIAPPTLVPLPVLFGAPFAVAVVWTLLVGAALLLCAALPRASLPSWLLGVSGLATLLLGLAWSSVEQHTMLAALVLVAAITMVSALSARRPSVGGEGEDDTAAAVYGTTVIVWAVALVIGGASLAATAARATSGAESHGPWWLLGATGLLLGATALVLDGVASRVLGATDDPRGEDGPGSDSTGIGPFGIGGLLLLIAQPLVVGPAGVPALSFFAWDHLPEGASTGALLEPAHEFIGLSDATTLAGLAVALGTLITGALAVGAVRLFHRGLLVPAAALLAPLTLVPLPFALGLPFLVALVCAVLVGAALTAGSGLVDRTGTAWVVWSAGLFTFALAFSWALSERYAAVGVLLAWAVAASVTSALARVRSITVASTAAATFGTGAFSLALLLAMGAPAEYAAFGPLMVVAAVAATAPRLRSPLSEATEIPAAVWAAIALLVTVGAGTRLELVALALAVVGVIALAGAVRPGRWWTALVGGLLMFCSLWTALAAWDVAVPEAYTVPPALAFLVIGWEWERRVDEAPASLLSYGGGLLLLLGPTVWLALDGQDLGWRVPVALVVGLATVVWGLRSRLQAQLLLGGGALLTVSLRAFGPPLWDLTLLLPNWVPFAVLGLLLLLIGARYEANLNRLRRVGRYVGALR